MAVQFRGMFEWIIVFYFYNIFLIIMHFIPIGYKRFLKTNSTDPEQRVPLKTALLYSVSFPHIINAVLLFNNFVFTFYSQPPTKTANISLDEKIAMMGSEDKLSSML